LKRKKLTRECSLVTVSTNYSARSAQVSTKLKANAGKRQRSMMKHQLSDMIDRFIEEMVQQAVGSEFFKSLGCAL
jgi:hypothetical protein